MTTQVGELLMLALSGSFSGGLWPGQARDKAQAPYGVYLHFGEPNLFAAGAGVDQRQRVQIDCYHTTYLQASQLADTVEAEMGSHSLDSSPSMFSAVLLNREYMGPDPDTKHHRVMLEYSFWYRPNPVVAAFSPDDLPNLAAWYRFGKGIFDSGGAVALWADASGNERHLVQDTAANQPSLQSDGSILFDGVADYLKTAAFPLVQPETVYLLGEQVSWTNGDFLFDGVGEVQGGSVRQAGSSPAIGLHLFGTPFGGGNGNWPLGSSAAICAVFNGASSLLQIDETAPTTYNGTAANMGGFTLGAASNFSGPANIRVREIAIFSAAHDAETRAQMIAYLRGLL